MEELRRCPVTIGLILSAIAGYALLGPVRYSGPIETFPDHLLFTFRHGNLSHLTLNCLLILVGGSFTEPVLGWLRTLGLVALFALAGTTAELLLAGPGFVGLSGVAYGLVSYGLIVASPPERRGWTLALICIVLGAEWLFLHPQIAVFTHITSALFGGGLAMFSALFGSSGPKLKPMEWRHVSPAIQIIAQTDEDDATEAESKFLEEGTDNMFVLQEKGNVLGLIGYSLDEDVPDVAWLSWTYLDQAHTGKGLGALMLNDLLGKLAQLQVRKIFIETSDYEEFGKKLYAAAHKLYEEFGASVELTVPGYHGPNEAKIVYGLENPEASETPRIEPSPNTGLSIFEIHKAPETDDVAGLRWRETNAGLSGLEQQLSLARSQKYRMAVLAIPSDLSDANAADLQAQGLQKCGELKEFYGKDLHQVWWSSDSGTTKNT
ncbi:GNAT family N-acetyltransferase [Ruegeria arenilitoris]|uniref:GNAT family N-acetyltransferase n=1 Tax=Ruegeria arenilitoris TaxID=1173585 RepID=UPI001480D682|nr:GNAT family N-acetyltransferase [Ruegeria arenilitoris]